MGMCSKCHVLYVTVQISVCSSIFGSFTSCSRILVLAAGSEYVSDFALFKLVLFVNKLSLTVIHILHIK